MPSRRLALIFGILTLFAGCTSVPPTADWHRRSAAVGSPKFEYNPFDHGHLATYFPPRGPQVPASKLSEIHVGDSGNRIYAVTRPDNPFYDFAPDLAFVTTSIRGVTYEGAFRYASDKSGRIAAISYLPVPNSPRLTTRSSEQAGR